MSEKPIRLGDPINPDYYSMGMRPMLSHEGEFKVFRRDSLEFRAKYATQDIEIVGRVQPDLADAKELFVGLIGKVMKESMQYCPALNNNF